MNLSSKSLTLLFLTTLLPACEADLPPGSTFGLQLSFTSQAGSGGLCVRQGTTSANYFIFLDETDAEPQVPAPKLQLWIRQEGGSTPYTLDVLDERAPGQSVKKLVYTAEFGASARSEEVKFSYEQKDYRLTVTGVPTGRACDIKAAEGVYASDAGTSGNTALDLYNEIARAKGCTEVESIKLDARCEVVAKVWLQCVRQDLTQCICESQSNKLNCEGSYKANEGPAKCIAESGALDQCEAALSDAGK